MAELPKEIEKYGDSLVKAWEQYLKIIDIYIALSGATGLIMGSLAKEIWLFNLGQHPYAITPIVFFGLCLLCLGLWRYSSQFFYEYETIGGAEIASKYFSYYGVKEPITRAFISNPKKFSLYKVIYRWTRYGSGVFYCLTWVSFISLALSLQPFVQQPANCAVTSPNPTVNTDAAHKAAQRRLP